ncbi:MAG: acyloxyacyl hydrolase, partial [Bacteroidia bacterium]|nr:acyloxyacyl hydrolase [Bacteroidia bacterium]
MRKLLFAILLSFLFGSTKGNNDSLLYKRTSFFLRASLHNGSIFAHSKRVDYSANAPVLGLEIELIRQRLDNLDAHYNPKGFATGFGLNFFNINNPVIKNNVNAFYTIESNILKTKKINLALKACAGLNFISSPYDSVKNQINWSYSSYVNAFLALGLVANFQFNNYQSIGVRLAFNHFSNGAIKDPNLGVNFLTGALSYQFKIADNVRHPLNLKRRLKRFEGRPNLQFTAFATYKSSTVNTEKFYLINGFAASYNLPFGVKQGHSLAIGGEWLEDRAISELWRYGGILNLSNQRVGVTVGHEFLFHQFTWGQYLGYYIFKDIPEMDNIYHRHT